MKQQQSKLSEAVEDCKYPLKIAFTFDIQEQVFCLAIGYEGSFPSLAKYEQIPEDLNQAVLDLLVEFDIESQNKQLTKQNLKDNGNRKVEPVKESIKSKNKNKKVKFAKSLI